MMVIESLEENFKFLILEVENQVKLTFGMLNDANPDLLEKITSKDDYVDNLKTVIENECFSRLNSSRNLKDDAINYIRSVHVICVNLERIADFCVNIARQTEFLIEFNILHQLGYKDMFTVIQASLSEVLPVLQARDLSGAMKICQAEKQLDDMYKDNFDWIMARMRTGQGHFIEDLFTTLFIFRYLERIGDALLNVGEALIFGILGERIKIDQLSALEKTVSQSNLASPLKEMDFKSIWGSRSGCRIGRVYVKEDQGRPAQAIFKEGKKAKVVREKENIECWERIMPGLVPKVYGFSEDKDSASMLVEFLPGHTLDTVILSADRATIEKALALLEEVLRRIWEENRREKPIPTSYMAQLKARMDVIRRVHPDFFRSTKRLNGLQIASSEELITACSRIEKDHQAPFSTRIHGDFNVNNVLFNSQTRKINFIDLYRSKESDYIQDASVFLVSNFRLPIFDPRLRQRLNWVAKRFFDFTLQFAQKNRDGTFELRMALALIRSFYTSTRFELNQAFALEMFKRAHYLMEKILDHSGSGEAFHVPPEILFY
jgi:phosphate uptake regulator/aminoglycoside phosphotransferase